MHCIYLASSSAGAGDRPKKDVQSRDEYEGEKELFLAIEILFFGNDNNYESSWQQLSHVSAMPTIITHSDNANNYETFVQGRAPCPTSFRRLNDFPCFNNQRLLNVISMTTTIKMKKLIIRRRRIEVN